jgi:hypothetical protein
MKTIRKPTAKEFDKNQSYRQAENLEERAKPSKSSITRRSFLGKSLAVGAGTVGAGFFINTRTARAAGGLTPGDAALLRFPAALERIEADFWIQYNELGGIPDSEVHSGTVNPAYHDALSMLDEDMDQYIHDNTDDEITHFKFLNAYLVSKGAAPADLNPFRTLKGSIARGVNGGLIGKRLTNLTQLTLDTSWWTRYRDDSHNPDLDPTSSSRRRSLLYTLGSIRQFPGRMPIQLIRISCRRSRILRLSTFQPLNKVATASTPRWHKGRRMRKWYVS